MVRVGLLQEGTLEPGLGEGEPDRRGFAGRCKEPGLPLSEIRDTDVTVLKDHSGAGLRTTCSGQREAH